MFQSTAIQAELTRLMPHQDRVTIAIFSEVDSTNALLWRGYHGDEQTPIVAIARSQTAGRGQWGHRWLSAEGGLYLSILCPLTLKANAAYCLTIASVTGVVTKLRSVGMPVQIKWPNDLLLGEKKLGGIKTETKLAQGQITAAVVGVGINYQNPVPNTGINLQSFYSQQNSLPITGDRLAALVIAGILQSLETFTAQSMEAILPNYLKYFKNLGEAIAYEGHQGIITGVSAQGELLAKLSAPGASSTIKIPPGQISLGYGSS